MIEWCRFQLHALDHDDDVNWNISSEVARRRQLEDEKMAARRGNLEPLRKRYPEIAEFIHAPRRAQGQRRSYLPKNWNVWKDFSHKMQLEMAIDDVRLLRTFIWPKHYGRMKRRVDDGPSAEDIVAELYKLDPDQIRDAIRARSRRVTKARRV